MAREQALNIWDRLAEERIARAQAQGEFDRLPGAGSPLNLDDDRLVPEEQRAALRVLKNAGCLPAELADLMALRQLQSIGHQGDAMQRRTQLARWQALRARLELAGLPLTAAGAALPAKRGQG